MACFETFDQPCSFILDQIYTSANDLFSKTHKFDHTSRTGPKVWCAYITYEFGYWYIHMNLHIHSILLQAFVSEYAVTGNDAGTGSLLAALAEGGFLIGLEKNRLQKMDYF